VSYLVPHFDPDVFVSYSHGDPIDGRAPLRDWTQALIRRLRDRLHALETEFDDLHLWMDPELDPTADLTSELRVKASACGALMIVMSKRYLKSRWCEKESEWFQQQIDGRATQVGRLFVVHAQRTDLKLWPNFLLDGEGNARMTGFSFFDLEDGSPLDFQLREPNEEYFRELGRLHTWLVARLRELRERIERQAPRTGPAPPPTGPRLIYLHAPPGSDSDREQVGEALMKEGIAPIMTPSRDVGRDLADWQREASERINMARHCEALTLLRVGDPGRFAGDLLGIGVIERNEMSGARGAPLPCAVLDKTGEQLPIDIVPFGIERFDVNRTDWRGQFRAWLDAARGAMAGAAP